MTEKALVGIAKVEQPFDNPKIRDAIFNLLGQMKERNKLRIKPRATVMVKPNICLVKGYETGATVDPFVVKCLVDWLFEKYEIESVTIGEADATELNADIAFKALGWEEVFGQYSNVRLLNLSKDKLVNVAPGGLCFRNLKVSKSYMESDYLVSVGKLKTHILTRISGILKNQFGANPTKHKAKYHPRMDQVIHDLNKIRLPDLCLMDGIIAMEGYGPVTGIPRPSGLLIVGNDAVATDHACARIMGVNPNKVSHLKFAMEHKLGSFDYDVFGEKIQNLAPTFEFIPTFTKMSIAPRRKFYYPLLGKLYGLAYLAKKVLEA